MATIQIRDLPEGTYETIRRRARAAGQSIQAYMRREVIAMAAAPTKDEAIAAVEASLAAHGASDATAADIAGDVGEDRR
jgi:plasmid stability protein